MIRRFEVDTRKHAAPLAAFAVLGVVATGYLAGQLIAPDNSRAACDDPQPLRLASMLDGNPLDGIKAANEGHCAALYDRDSLKTIATIATHESFVVVCQDAKPNSFMVEAGDTTGFVNFTDSFRFEGDGQPLIQGC